MQLKIHFYAIWSSEFLCKHREQIEDRLLLIHPFFLFHWKDLESFIITDDNIGDENALNDMNTKSQPVIKFCSILRNIIFKMLSV